MDPLQSDSTAAIGGVDDQTNSSTVVVENGENPPTSLPSGPSSQSTANYHSTPANGSVELDRTASRNQDEQVLAAKKDFEKTLEKLSFLSTQTPSKPHPDLNQPTAKATIGDKKYEYTPLNYEKNEIRLLLLLPAVHWDDPIMCDLAAFPLGEKMQVPYDVLSYSQEDSQDTVPIDIHRAVHHVTPNIATFLRTRRHELSHTTRRPGVVWVDTLCINQGDMREKEQQASAVKEIYARANSLLVWLGEETTDSNLGMDLLRRLGSPGHKNESVWVMEDHELLALENLFKRPWWGKTSTIQQLLARGSSNDAVFWSRMVMCGFTVLPWYYIVNAMDRLLYHHDPSQPHFTFLKPILDLKVVREAEI